LFITGNYNNGKEHSAQLPLAVNAHITIDTLMAGGTACYNISGNVYISDGKTEIKSFTFNYAGGKVSLEGVFRSNEDNTVTGNVISGSTAFLSP
jgi:hypothetical protein